MAFQAELLIVDYTPANLRLLSQILTEHGYNVRAATSAAGALEAARSAPPNLILLEIRMPDMDGIEICRSLKEDELTREVPVIFISALDDIQDKLRAFKAGGLDYIIKPFQVDEVLARVETHLNLRSLQLQFEDANRRLERELNLAARVQTSMLPAAMPTRQGWHFSACLDPALETSGDFYDVFNLPGGRLGLLVADVVDKGVAAAMLMAISWNLFDTHAPEHPSSPSGLFLAANRHMLARLDGVMFMTAFYGILEPESGRLTYCNAGQVPPLVVSGADGSIRKLVRTGLPLGVMEDSTWETASLTLKPGDTLVAYTDGVTDAQSCCDEAFGEARLLEVVQEQARGGGACLCDTILAEIKNFVGGLPQYDDITLMVVGREKSG